MISSISANAYNAFSTISAKIQATSLWSQLPAKSTVAKVALMLLIVNYTNIAAKIQATSLWSKLPAKSTVTAVASNILFSKYTYAVIGVGIFCAAAKRGSSNYQNYVNNPTKADRELTTIKLDANEKPILDDKGYYELERELIPAENNHTLKGKVSAVILPSLIATAALSATIASLILLP